MHCVTWHTVSQSGLLSVAFRLIVRNYAHAAISHCNGRRKLETHHRFDRISMLENAEFVKMIR